MTEAVAPTPGLSRALTRAGRGQTLNPDEAALLLGARGEALGELTGIAGRLRDRGLRDAGRPGVVTFSPKVFLPVTRLCRDRCKYCTFVRTPVQLAAVGADPYLSPDEILEVARAGAAAGCLEALFTLGDRPETRWPQAAAWLESRGYSSTLEYVRAMAVLVLEETGLLPHVNPGVMTWEEMLRLKPVAPSLGMMLETTSTRLFTEPGAAHYGSPDKDPAVRLRVLEDAGRAAVPFTTGVLLGIGETELERAESLLAIRGAHRRHRHVQEVIVQAFRAKPDTAMRGTPDLADDELQAAVAVARIVLGPGVRVQVPPNLSDLATLPDLLAAGADDWGGVSPVTLDHVNPERAWPELGELRRVTEQAGFTLAARLTAHPDFVRAGAPWIDPLVQRHVAALADPASGLARDDARASGLPWQQPDQPWESAGRTALHREIDLSGRRADRRSDFDVAYGEWAAVAEQATAIEPPAAPAVLLGDVGRALRMAEVDPARLARLEHEDLAVALMTADGAALEHLCALADAVRRDVVGDDVTYVVNRNVNFTNVCYVGCRFCAFAQRKGDADAFVLSLAEIQARVREAVAAGGTEVCLQGGIDPDLPPDGYAAIARAVKEAAPRVHLHAFSPMEIVSGASRAGLTIREFLTSLREAGLDTIPGTAAEILDDEVRWVLTKGKLPAATWVEVVTTAHELGIRSSSTMMYGHVDHPRHWVAHLRLLAEIQARTGGFTEFVPLPFVHQGAPIYLAGIARPGPTTRDDRAVHAMGRLMLHGLIDHVQASWVKLGDQGVLTMLSGGVDDLGGTLMEETISRMAGANHGSARTVAELEGLIRRAGRRPAQRTTTYDVLERAEALR